MHHAQHAGARCTYLLGFRHEIIGNAEQLDVVGLAVGQCCCEVLGCEAVFQQGLQLVVIGLPDRVDLVFKFAATLRDDGLQVHRFAITARNGAAIAESRLRDLEDLCTSAQFGQGFGLVRRASNAHGVKFKQGACDALRHITLAARKVDGNGVLVYLERGVEVQHQYAQVKQQEEGDRNDDLAVLAKSESAAFTCGAGFFRRFGRNREAAFGWKDGAHGMSSNFVLLVSDPGRYGDPAASRASPDTRSGLLFRRSVFPRVPGGCTGSRSRPCGSAGIACSRPVRRGHADAAVRWAALRRWWLRGHWSSSQSCR